MANNTVLIMAALIVAAVFVFNTGLQSVVNPQAEDAGSGLIQRIFNFFDLVLESIGLR